MRLSLARPLLLLCSLLGLSIAPDVRAAEAAPFQPPASPRATFNFNPGWKFAFGNATGAEQPGFDDSSWAGVSLPHTWNETDTYRAYISHSAGDQG